MTLVGKALAISILAGALAAAPFAILFTLGMGLSGVLFVAPYYLAFGVTVSLVVGLPIAILVFWLVKSDQSFTRAHLFLVANGVATVIVTILGVLDGSFGAFFLGLPVFLAANVYVIAGWRLVLRYYREGDFA